MPDSLADLEARRTAVQMQIAQLGDMRSGSITGTGGRCGNPNCHCHRAADPGHGPYYRLTRKVNGKTVTETFSSPAGLAKAQREVAECQRFRELGDQLLEVNERVCQLRPVEEHQPSAQEKKRPNHAGADKQVLSTELWVAHALTRASKCGERCRRAELGSRSTRLNGLGCAHTRQAEGIGGLLQSGAPPRSSRFPSIDRKSTRLNSSHLGISYAVFCL